MRAPPLISIVKAVETHEIGCYDVVVLPKHEYKCTFREGEVAILPFPRPGSASSICPSFLATAVSSMSLALYHHNLHHFYVEMFSGCISSKIPKAVGLMFCGNSILILLGI